MKVQTASLSTNPDITARFSTRSLGVAGGVWLSVAVLLAAVVRVVGLGDQSFWLDEGVSYMTAVRPLPDLLDHVRRADIHPPLYYVLLHFWLVGGNSETWLRLLSTLFSVASVALIGV